MNQIITPTPGRIVHFYPQPHEGMHQIHAPGGGLQPLAAMVVGPWSDTMVNLVIWDANGVSHLRTSVPLVQPGATAPGGQSYCAWMPYQVGQAAKTEALQEKLASAQIGGAA